MTCKHNKSIKKVAPLSSKDENSYLVSLGYAEPNSFFGWPIYWLRANFSTHIKIFASEVEKVTWKESSIGWCVTLANGKKLDGLDSIKPFIDMKNDFYKS